jgi:hypothetical protein
MTAPLGHRDLLKLKRHHWQSLKDGDARLSWDYAVGRFKMYSSTAHVVLPENCPLDTLNAEWSAFVAKH